MAQQTANEIIQGAFKTIGVYSEESVLEGFRAQEGLYYLNMLLDSFATKDTYISFNDLLNFTLTPNKRVYELSNLITADVTSNRLVSIRYLALAYNNFSYPVLISEDYDFYMNKRNLLTSRRPRRVFLQNNISKSLINFFYAPDYAYECTIKGKFVLNRLDFVTDVIEGVPADYILFLEMALARLLHSKFPGSAWTEMNEREYNQAKIDMKASVDKPDMTVVRYDYDWYSKDLLNL